MGFIEKSGASRERIVTGLALLGVVGLIAFIDNFFLTWLLLGVVYMLAFYEATRLFGIEQRNSLFAYAAMIWIAAAYYPYGDDLFVIAGIVFASYIAFTQKNEWSDFLPFLYPTAGMLFLLTMYSEYGMLSLVWLLVVVAMTDVGAFFVGKKIGKTPFCATSPNKTMEGVLGGVAVATIAGFFIGMSLVDGEKAALVSLLTAVSAIFGDLFESALKRKAGVKDSGNILPGHGGILDRIDGYLFGAVIMLVMLRGLV